MSHNLWVFHGGAMPQQVVIYLAEQQFLCGFIKIIPTTMSGPGAPAVAPNKPPGSIPLLRLPSGELISKSLSIIEYLEDVAASQNMVSMHRNTAIERAKVHTLLIETVTLSVKIAAVNRSVAFASLVDGQQSASLERWLLAFIDKNLKRILDLAERDGGPFHVGGMEITTLDCALFATLQYAGGLWGMDLIEEKHPRLQFFYNAFLKRASAVVPENAWPKEMIEFTSKFIDF